MSEARLSVVVITRNEAHRIGRCLASVAAIADEAVVLDSGSTDDTVALAQAAGARVSVSTEWPGFGPQKNRAIGLARGRWILSLDADEVLSAELATEIAQLLAAEARGEDLQDAYWLSRRSRWCGRVIRFGDWRRDRVLRLFRAGKARFSDEPVHERLECAGSQGRLRHWLMHDSVDSPADGREKSERYARLGAMRLRERGRGGILPAIAHGLWSFVRGYLLRLGFLDLGPGLAIAWMNARATYLRYRWAAMPLQPDSLPRG